LRGPCHLHFSALRAFGTNAVGAMVSMHPRGTKRRLQDV
jgi:hypothetical protein